jgi:type II secretory pathway pseudopilin PulG
MLPHFTPRHQNAMTLPETLIAATVVGLALIAVALGLSTMRTDLRRSRTVELLVMLDQALAMYQHETGQWPVIQTPSGGRESTRADLQNATDQRPDSDGVENLPSEREESGNSVIALLAEASASREALQRVPEVMRSPVAADSRLTPSTLPSALSWTVHDAWGRPLRCLTAASPTPLDREAVAANRGRPIFISAGEDGDFGLRDRSAAADNIRSDELRK